MPDESDDEEDQLEDDEYNTVTETPNATMRPMAVRHSGPPAGVPTDHDSDDYDSEAHHIRELQSSDAPVIIGAPPPPDSNHPRGRRFFADRTIDEAGLSRYRQSKGDPKGGKSISSPRTRLSEVFSAPPAKKTRDSKRKAAKRSVDELGEELESEVSSAPPAKKTRDSKRKAAERSVDELGEELESE
ncbi:hypothetical protein DXG01_011983, partial [Tephrocybe rancida]